MSIPAERLVSRPRSPRSEWQRAREGIAQGTRRPDLQPRAWPADTLRPVRSQSVQGAVVSAVPERIRRTAWHLDWDRENATSGLPGSTTSPLRPEADECLLRLVLAVALLASRRGGGGGMGCSTLLHAHASLLSGGRGATLGACRTVGCRNARIARPGAALVIGGGSRRTAPARSIILGKESR